MSTNLHPKWIDAVERHDNDPENDDWMFINPTTGEPEINWQPTTSVWNKIKEKYNSYFNTRK